MIRLSRLILLLCCLVWRTAAIAEDLTGGTWLRHGFTAQSRDALQDHLRTSVHSGTVPGGALLLIRNDETIMREGFGFGHIRRQQPFTPDAVFRIASLSKPIIATLVVKLHADGVLDMHQPIRTYLPQAELLRLQSGEKPSRIPTLAECLKHTAAFAADESEIGRPWLTFTGKGLSLAEVVQHEVALPMSRDPGQTFAYSGIGYDIAGRIIESVTDRSLEQVLQSELCEPLGMTHTTYYPDRVTYDAMPSFYWKWRSDGKFRRRIDRPLVPTGEYVSVGGGIVSTLDDLASFLRLHRNLGNHQGKPLLPRAAIEKMYVREEPGSFYGCGFTLGPADENGLASWIYHTGSSGTMFWLDRQRDTIGVLATQHALSAGEAIPESKKLIKNGTPSWQKVFKQTHLDPILGWNN